MAGRATKKAEPPQSAAEAMRGFFRLLKDQVGLGRPELPCVLGGKGKFSEAQVYAGWRDTKIALTLPGEDGTPFARRGWTVVELNQATLKAVVALAGILDEMRFARIVADADNAAKMTTSKAETRLLAGMLRAGLPEPNRNLEVFFPDDDPDRPGELATTPDFAWDDARLIVELDGYYFHKGMALEERLGEALADPATQRRFKDKVQLKDERDAAKRRLLTALGWTVMIVFDTEIDTPEKCMAVANRIRDAHRTVVARI